MGHRLTQKIYTCDVCGVTPEDGEYMWHMGNEIWCEKCCDTDNEKIKHDGWCKSTLMDIEAQRGANDLITKSCQPKFR